MVEARADFDRANQVMVSRKMHRPRSQIVADLRTHAASRFTPPTMDWHAPLTDFLVHRLDVTHPLGLAAGGPLEAWAPALDMLVSKAATRGFMDRGRPELTYVATDLDWRHGSGPRGRRPRRGPRARPHPSPGASRRAHRAGDRPAAGWATRRLAGRRRRHRPAPRRTGNTGVTRGR